MSRRSLPATLQAAILNISSLARWSKRHRASIPRQPFLPSSDRSTKGSLSDPSGQGCDSIPLLRTELRRGARDQASADSAGGSSGQSLAHSLGNQQALL